MARACPLHVLVAFRRPVVLRVWYYCGLNCPSAKNLYFKSQLLILHNVTVFGDRGFKEVRLNEILWVGPNPHD